MKEEWGDNMDDVLNIEKCKICGGLVSIENSSDGTTKICTCCGYFYNKENPKHELGCEECHNEESDSGDVKEIEYLNPCGAYKLVTLSGIGQVGTLGENVREEDVLKKFNFSDTSRLDLNKSYINYRNTETNEFKIIFGNGQPESYDEFVGRVKH